MAASLSGVFNLQQFTDLGALGVGMRLYTYIQGTTTHKIAYTDQAGTISHTYTSDGSGGQYIALNARGELPAPLYLTSGSYDLALKTSTGATVWTRRADPVYADIAASGGSALVGFLQAGTGADARTAQDKMRETLSVYDFMTAAQITDVESGAPTLDHSAQVSDAFTELKARGGGTLLFPNKNSIYQFYLNVSGVNPDCIFDFDGSRIRPFNSAATNSTILFADNQASSFLSTNIRTKRGVFDGRVGGSGTGSIDYCIRLNWASIEDDSSTFSYAKVAGVYGNYAQYTKLIDPHFSSNAFNSSSWGAYFTGPDSGHRSNEVHIVRPRLFSNYNGIFNGGGEAMRITSPTVQNQTGLGIHLHTDAAGNGARSTHISDPWFEINTGYSIKIGTASSTTIVSPRFLTASALTIQTDTCYELTVIEPWGNSPVSDIKHPAANTDTSSMVWLGGNFSPTLTLAHNGPIRLNVDTPSTSVSRKDNMLASSAQTVQGLAAVGIPDWYGIKAGVLKGVATNLFTLTQTTAGTLAHRVAVFTVELYLFDDATSTTQFGYSGHTQRYSVIVTNNTSGAPQVFIVAETTGVNVGVDTAYQAPGDTTLSSSVSGDVITIKASWPGTGTGASGMTTQSVAYMVRGVGTNSFYMTRS